MARPQLEGGTCGTARRQAFDDLYGPGSTLDVREKLALAYPLLLFFFEAKSRDDRQRLVRFAEDVGQIDSEPVMSGELPPARLGRFVRVLVAALQEYAISSQPG